MGLGQKLGAEKVHKAAVIALHKRAGCGALGLDLTSAFTRIKRSEIAGAIMKKVPELGPWVVALLNNHSTGQWQDGDDEITVDMLDGLDIGCPASMLLFILGEDDWLRTVKRATIGADPLAWRTCMTC